MEPWDAIFKAYNIDKHNFDKSPFEITAQQIKDATKGFARTGQREVRILCKQDTRECRPDIFKKLGLFIIPIQNGRYAIIKGEGYLDIPEIPQKATKYVSKLDFSLDTALIDSSIVNHIDYAFAVSIIRTFMKDDSLVLTIRGRKYTPEFSFNVGSFTIDTKSVQTEVDAGYEGKKSVVLLEAKSSNISNTIIRQLYYPFRQWSLHTKKKVYPLFFAENGDEYHIWQFEFTDPMDYNSISLLRAERFIMQ